MQKNTFKKPRSSKSTLPPKNDVDMRRVSNAMLILIAICVALFVFQPFLALPIFLFLPFLMSDLSSPELILCNSSLAILITTASYLLIARKQSNSRKRLTLAIAFCASIAITLVLSHWTIPVYRQYRVAHVPPMMENYLEKKYGEDFTVEKATYHSTQYLGDSKGVSATAYPLSEPTFRFMISETGDGGYREEFIEKFGKKIKDTVTAQLTEKFQKAFGGRLSIGSVSYSNLTVPVSAVESIDGKTISANIKEDFMAGNWGEIEKIMRDSVGIVSQAPYKPYQYFFSVDNTPDEVSHATSNAVFNCDFTASQKNDDALNSRINYCISSYNEFHKSAPKIPFNNRQ